MDKKELNKRLKAVIATFEETTARDLQKIVNEWKAEHDYKANDLLDIDTEKILDYLCFAHVDLMEELSHENKRKYIRRDMRNAMGYIK